jgi:protein gp37
VRTTAANWRKPVQWNAATFVTCQACGWRGDLAEAGVTGACPSCSSVDRYVPARRRVFCASLADVFDNEVDPAWRHDLFNLIRDTPSLDWLLLTKRIGNVERMVAESGCVAGNGTRYLPSNVQLGATITSQPEADRDVVKLLLAKVELGIRVVFLSMEPLLGPVDIRRFIWPVHGWWKGPHRSYAEAKAAGAECGLKRQALVSAHAQFIDWVIVGGESGAGARAMHPDWVRSLRDQCAAAGVPFHFKQWGEWAPSTPDEAAGNPRSGWRTVRGHPAVPKREELLPEAGAAFIAHIGKKAAGRLLDGVTHDGFPEVRS